MAEGWSVVWCLLALSIAVHSVSCGHVFFHEPSAVLVHESSDFGFALSYWDKSLITSSPRSDRLGKVYRCPVAGMSSKHLSCSHLDVFHPNTYTNITEQNFFLGASIAATNDYLFTCAPMVTKEIYGENDAVGSCFRHSHKDTMEYVGPESYYDPTDANSANRDIYEGGTGWNMLADEENGLLVVAKTSLWGKIFFASVTNSDNEEDQYLFEPKEKEDKSEIYNDILNMGYGMTSGKFFGYETVYAFNKQTQDMTGQIAFLKITEEDDVKSLQLIFSDDCEYESCILTISDDVMGCMFGYALGAADLNLDGLSELLVGAPLDSEDENEVEFGALHIYFGGDMKSMNEPNRKRIIYGAKAMGRFGSTVATNDVDGDGISEVFVSAPYEESGVLYVLSGRELREGLLAPSSAQQLLVSRLQHSQRILREELALLGFSVLSVPDVDGNGCNEVAIGAPGASSVLLLRCLQTISVNITYQLYDVQYVKEKDSNCTVMVCLHIDYQTKSNRTSGYISAKNDISGNAKIITPTFEVDLSKRHPQFCQQVVVNFTKLEKNDYQLTTSLEIKNDRSLESEDFDESWAKFSPYSQTTSEYRIHRKCKDEDCNPNLALEIKWNNAQLAKKTNIPNSYSYDVESSTQESVSIIVVNKGFEVSEACVKVELSGAPVHKSGACLSLPESGYECALPTPFRRTDNAHLEEAKFDILLNMSSLSNTDKSLVVYAQPFNNCYQKGGNTTREQLVINYSFEKAWKKVGLTGKNNNLTVSDIEISEEELKKSEENILRDEHQYTISNEGSVLWKNIIAIIEVESRPFITKVGTTEKDCVESQTGSLHRITCSLTLPPVTIKKDTPIMVWVEIPKKEVGEELKAGRQMNVMSNMTIFMDSINQTKYKSLVTDIEIKKETTFGRNKNMIILIGVILALLLLALFILCLYKKGFFKRKQKKELNVLRESVRRRSIRLASEKSSRHSQKPSNADDDPHIDIEVVEDSPFEEVPISSKDNVVLIGADVHKEDKKEGNNEEHAKKV